MNKLPSQDPIKIAEARGIAQSEGVPKDEIEPLAKFILREWDNECLNPHRQER